MGLFGRRAKGRHALGAAVTSIPSGPLPSLATENPVATPVEAPAASASPPAAVEHELTPEQVEDLAALAPLVAPELLSEIASLVVTGEAWAEIDIAAAAPVAPRPANASSGAACVTAAPAEPAAPVTGLADDVADLFHPPAGPPAEPSAPVAVPAQALTPAPAPGALPLPVVAGSSAPATQVLAAPAPAAPAPAAPAPAAAAPAAAAQAARSALETGLAELLPQQGLRAETAPQVVSADAAPGPLRVQLGFRDGTSTSLDPASDQSQALQELARSLTRRD